MIAYDYELATSYLSKDFAQAIRMGKGRAPRSMRKFVEDELIVPNGPQPGRFKLDSQPILRLWFDALDQDWYTECVFSGPSQSGKSLFGYVVPTIYHLFELQETVVFGVPIDEMANDKWKADIRPIMDASPHMRRWLPRKGSGSAGGDIADLVQFGNGTHLKIAAAGGSDQGKAGFTARVLVVTEAAGFSEGTSVSTEADPLRQMRARLKSYDYDQRRIYIEGTKQTANRLPYMLRAQSTKSQIKAPCPHCGAHICPGRESLIGWKDARDEVEVEERATWSCPVCKEPITDEERRQVLTEAVLLHEGQSISRRGVVSWDDGRNEDRPRTRRLWFDYGAWHNCFLSAAAVAMECWSAEQIEPTTPERMSADRELSQFSFGEVYTPPVLHDTTLVDPKTIAGHRLPIPRGVLPSDTTFWTIGIDMGKRFGHLVAIAFRESGAVHVVDYFTFDVQNYHPFLDEAIKIALAAVDEQFKAGLPVDGTSNRQLPQAIFVDRGWVPTPIVTACASLGEKWIPIIGRGETQMDRTRYRHPKRKTNTIRELDPEGRFYLERISKPAWTLQAYIDSDAYKRLLPTLLIPSEKRVWDDQLTRFTYFAGVKSVHDKYLKQLCSEQEVLIEMAGQASEKKWLRSGANHYGDATCYALAAGNWCGFRWAIQIESE